MPSPEQQHHRPDDGEADQASTTAAGSSGATACQPHWAGGDSMRSPWTRPMNSRRRRQIGEEAISVPVSSPLFDAAATLYPAVDLLKVLGEVDRNGAALRIDPPLALDPRRHDPEEDGRRPDLLPLVGAPLAHVILVADDRVPGRICSRIRGLRRRFTSSSGRG
jgi:hypothetical protein